MLRSVPYGSANATDDPRFAHKSFLAQVDSPIRLFAADEIPIGIIRVHGEEVGELTPGQIPGLGRLAVLTMSIFSMRSTALNLGGLAAQDALTGLPNRWAFEVTACGCRWWPHGREGSRRAHPLGAVEAITTAWGAAARTRF